MERPENIKVSIGVPIYRTEKYIRSCIDSLLNQTYKNLEIILVDDGSPDSCSQICDEYAASDDRVIVIHKQNEGQTGARRDAVSKATGQYFMFIDSDDWIDEETISDCIEKIEANDNIDCVLFTYVKERNTYNRNTIIFNEDFYCSGNEGIDRIYRRIFGPVEKELSNPEKLDYLSSTCLKLYRRSLLNNIKYYDTNEVGSCEDGLFNIYALYGAKSFYYINKPYYHYRLNEESFTRTFKEELPKLWQNLFDAFQHFIDEHALGERYNEALNNRIACGVFQIAHGIVLSENRLGKKLRLIDEYISNERINNSLRQLEKEYLPFPWKVLMLSAQYKMPLIVYLVVFAAIKLFS